MIALLILFISNTAFLVSLKFIQAIPVSTSSSSLSSSTFYIQANLMPWFIILLTARTVQGVASAALMTAGMSWISLLVPEDRRGLQITTATVGVALGVFVGPPLAGMCMITSACKHVCLPLYYAHVHV
jgi:MFS family permease